jgi:hypothetical protein
MSPGTSSRGPIWTVWPVSALFLRDREGTDGLGALHFSIGTALHSKTKW